MIITALDRNARRRSRIGVYVDGMIACEISRATVQTRGLRIGSDLGEGGVPALVEDDQRRGALEAAAAMLARRPRSERDVRRRLAQRKYPAAIVEATIARLAAARLLDDGEFARSVAESRDRTSPRSKRMLVSELRAAGVAGEIATDAVSGIDDADAAYRLASSRMRSLAALDEDRFRARLAGLLQRRGFGWGVVRASVDRCWRETQGAAGAPAE